MGDCTSGDEGGSAAAPARRSGEGGGSGEPGHDPAPLRVDLAMKWLPVEPPQVPPGLGDDSGETPGREHVAVEAARLREGEVGQAILGAISWCKRIQE